MGIAKKGTRRIVVEGETYRWVVSPDDEPGLGIVIEKDNFHGQRLVAWVEHDNIISPGLVKKVILLALEEGWWSPMERKSQISIGLDNEFINQ
jgi:hypothetical protein